MMNFNLPGNSNDMDPMCGGFQLSRKQRLYGFGACWALGIVLSALSTLLLFVGRADGFAALYTFGNILSLAGTGFLIGFMTQFKKMFDSTRLIATCVFLGTMIATFVIAFTVQPNALRGTLCLVFCCIQSAALFWYSLSYIPFARDAFKKFCMGCMKSG